MHLGVNACLCHIAVNAFKQNVTYTPQRTLFCGCVIAYVKVCAQLHRCASGNIILCKITMNMLVQRFVAVSFGNFGFVRFYCISR